MGETRIVLAMHGAPPRDFPHQELGELMGLHSRIERMPPGAPGRAEAERRLRELDEKIRTWPRTEANDPFHAASLVLARELGQVSGRSVRVGFNEFCAPDLGQTLDEAAAGAARVIVVTPMLTAGGEHAEVDLPRQVALARQRHPGVTFIYAWPYDPATVAQFLVRQVGRFDRE